MKTLCIDLGGSRVKLAVVDAGCIEEMRIFPIDHDSPMSEVLQSVESQARNLPSVGGCLSIGFAYPGIVDARRQRVMAGNGKYTDAATIDYAAWARERFGLPLILTNDAAAAICGEMAYGAGQGNESAVLLMIGTGIGTAAYSQGKVLTGKHGTLGILGGHIAIAHEAPRRCTCGNLGCLEAYAGTWALANIAQEHPGFKDSCLKDVERIDYCALAAGCAAGDSVCRDVFDGVCRALGTGAVNLIHAYDPEILILSGGASHIAALRTAIQTHMDAYSWTPWGHVQVVTAKEPEASVVLGLSSLFEER